MKCIVCSNEIPKEYTSRNPKYCSRQCYLTIHKAIKEFRTCPICHKQFLWYSRAKKIFCSLKCRYESTLKIGERYIAANGYVYVKVAPAKYMLEHRVILERKLNRKLRKEEHVHHLNGIKTDNRTENIVLFASNSDHTKHHNTLYGGKHPKDSKQAVAKRIATKRERKLDSNGVL